MLDLEKRNQRLLDICPYLHGMVNKLGFRDHDDAFDHILIPAIQIIDDTMDLPVEDVIRRISYRIRYKLIEYAQISKFSFKGSYKTAKKYAPEREDGAENVSCWRIPLPLELREILELSCDNELQLKLVSLRIQNYTFGEASKILGVSKTVLCTQFESIVCRVRYLWNKT